MVVFDYLNFLFSSDFTFDFTFKTAPFDPPRAARRMAQSNVKSEKGN